MPIDLSCFRLGTHAVVPSIHDRFGRWIPAFAGMTGSALDTAYRHSRESGNPPAGIVASKDERAGITVKSGHLSPCPNTNAVPGGHALSFPSGLVDEVIHHEAIPHRLGIVSITGNLAGHLAGESTSARHEGRAVAIMQPRDGEAEPLQVSTTERK